MTKFPIRCHLQTQLSWVLITEIIPSKLELVQAYTFSRLLRILRNSSQLSHPSNSNWSNVLIREHTKQARRLRRSLGTTSNAAIVIMTCMAFLIGYFPFSKVGWLFSFLKVGFNVIDLGFVFLQKVQTTNIISTVLIVAISNILISFPISRQNIIVLLLNFVKWFVILFQFYTFSDVVVMIFLA